MDHPSNGIADHQRHALDFALDALGLDHARLDAHQTVDVTRLKLTIAALRTENGFLRARVATLERLLYPDEQDLAALERQVDRRAGPAPERQPDDI